jgi:hypothetical protein
VRSSFASNLDCVGGGGDEELCGGHAGGGGRVRRLCKQCEAGAGVPPRGAVV